jgi:hypothetical protein
LCQTPSGSGSSKTVAVTRAGLVGSQPAVFTFDGARRLLSRSCGATRLVADRKRGVASADGW